MKLDQNRELAPGIARILCPLGLGISSSQKNEPLVLGRSRPPKNGRRSDHQPQNTGNIQKMRPAPLGASAGFDALVEIHQIISKNGPAIPPLNISIIP